MTAAIKTLVGLLGVAAVGACSSDSELAPSYNDGPNRPMLALIVFGVVAFVLIMVSATVLGRRFLQRRARWRTDLAVVDQLGGRARTLVGEQTAEVLRAGTPDALEPAWGRANRSANDIQSQARELADSMGETEISDRLEGLASSVATLRRALETFVDSGGENERGQGTRGPADLAQVETSRRGVEAAIEQVSEERTRLRRPEPTFDDQF